MPYYIKKNNRYLTLEDVSNEHYDDEFNIVNESVNTQFNWTTDYQYAKSFYDRDEAERYVYYFRKVLKDVEIVREKG